MEDQKKTILMIDDDENLLMATKELLENWGYKVYTHRRGFGSTAAIDLVKPDLVLLDINMPALPGDRLAGLIKSFEATKNVPIVFYSSNDEDALREAVAMHKVRGYIPKGDIYELKTRLRQYLNRA
ncbi:MAG: response regulator [Nitrospiraceae bacterium]|nr:response regulator [Nitrospiraceae bacterium]MDA8091053.1 response regulator [Nitrospiraceae bacterium]